MPTSHKLAGELGRKGERPEVWFAEEIVENQDTAAIRELFGLLGKGQRSSATTRSKSSTKLEIAVPFAPAQN